MPPGEWERKQLQNMKTVTHSKSFEIAAPLAKLFPLFSPEGEKAWVPGWDYENVMGTTELSEDYVFLTKSHDHAAAEAIWIVKRYEPENHLIQLYKIEPGEKIGTVTVDCADVGNGCSKVAVTYKYQALSEAGSRFIAGFDESTYEAFIGEWKELLVRYFSSVVPSGL